MFRWIKNEFLWFVHEKKWQRQFYEGKCTLNEMREAIGLPHYTNCPEANQLMVMTPTGPTWLRKGEQPDV